MFSVVIPYYKKRQYIERCIDSVLAQTYTDYEIILVDDGSNDDVSNLVNEKYAGRIKLIHQQNQGVSAARNKGIANANKEYIAFLDADDCWSSHFLKHVNSIIRSEGKLKVIGANYSAIESHIETPIRNLKYKLIDNYFKDQVFKNTLFTSSSSIIHNSFFKTNNGFNKDLKRGEDLDVWFRAIASGGKVIYINNKLVYYSQEDENQVTKTNFDFKYSILSVMGSDYLKKDCPEVLRRFAPIFIRKRIYPYFFSVENHKDAKRVLKEIGYGNFFSSLLYKLPFCVGQSFSNSKYISYYSKYLVK